MMIRTFRRVRCAHSSNVSAASNFPWRRYNAPKFFSVVVTVGLQGEETTKRIHNINGSKIDFDCGSTCQLLPICANLHSHRTMCPCPFLFPENNITRESHARQSSYFKTSQWRHDLVLLTVFSKHPDCLVLTVDLSELLLVRASEHFFVEHFRVLVFALFQVCWCLKGLSIEIRCIFVLETV